jgi:dihydropyrimidinase
MRLDCVVRGGTITTVEASVVADIGIKDGRIAAIARDLNAEHVVDATGMLVVPGAIDVHTHFANDVGGVATADDYESGSRAAAVGGITSFVNFAFQLPGRTLVESVEAELRKADGHSYLDFGLHVAITDPQAVQMATELAELAERGITSVKIFTAVERFQLARREMLLVMDAASSAGMMVNVHAEDGALVDYQTKRLLRRGDRSVQFLSEARPVEAEALATAMVSTYAAMVGCAVYFVHLSCRAALDAVRRARQEGNQVYVETRPAYLFLDNRRYELPDFEGNKYVCWPPLRSADDQIALWEGLRNGEIQTYATDHTTWTAAQKMDPGLDFHEIPGGVSNVQTSIGMLFAEGVQRGRISMSRFVEVTATNPAKLFGMWPQKGTLAVGADADLVLIDPTKEAHIRGSEMESRSDFDPYDGWKGVGWPVLTMSRGEVVVRDGKVVAACGRGRPIHRERYQCL